MFHGEAPSKGGVRTTSTASNILSKANAHRQRRPAPQREALRAPLRAGVEVNHVGRRGEADDEGADDAVAEAWPRASLSLSADIYLNALNSSDGRMYL